MKIKFACPLSWQVWFCAAAAWTLSALPHGKIQLTPSVFPRTTRTFRCWWALKGYSWRPCLYEGHGLFFSSSESQNRELKIHINFSILFFLQSRDYISKAQAGQSAEKFAEVISRLRFSSDEGVKYSGDLLAIMETLRNTTELCKANGLRLNNADVEVSRSFFQVGTCACIFDFFFLCFTRPKIAPN